MAITIKTKDPTKLLADIGKAIGAGRVQTWTRFTDGDFTHSPEQWKNKAYLRPSIAPGELKFGVVANDPVDLSWELYGVFQGRFIEMLIIHFHDSISTLTATAFPESPDVTRKQ